LEYITAGGCSSKRLPPSLLREAQLMRDALLADLSAINDIEIVTSHDARLHLAAEHMLMPCIETICIGPNDNAITIWQTLLQRCDAVLLIAPETEQLLSKLTSMAAMAGVKNLGCTQSAVDLATNKYDTCRRLQAASILTIATYRVNEFLQPALQHSLPADRAYVLKPIDGAGCTNTLYFNDAAALNSYLNRELDADSNAARPPANNAQPASPPSDLIIQPYQAGTPASMTLLCKQGRSWLISCNQQHIVINQEQNPASIEYRGGQVNSLPQQHAVFAQLAQTIAAAIPGLNGYVGVDVIIDGAHIYVVEINPRITTSYIGLRESLGCNPMQLLLDLECATDLAADFTAAATSNFTLPQAIGNKAVEIKLYA
jgi:predicted ATP-grasp superfamily ATP-dependent carboligase